jgi:hypothetical protein
MLSEEMALESALRQVWDLKKELRRELKTERAAMAELVRERLRLHEALRHPVLA